MKNKIITIFLALLIAAGSSCTSDSKATRTLADAGYTEINTGGWAPFMCSEDDTYKTKFSAKAPGSDRVVSGAVCCGLVAKGCTIRH